MGEVDLLGKKGKEKEKIFRNFAIEYTNPKKEQKEQVVDSGVNNFHLDHNKKRKFSEVEQTQNEKTKSIDINLFSREVIKARYSPFIKAVFSGLIFVLFVYLILFVWQFINLDSMVVSQKEIREIDKEIAQYEPTRERVNAFSEKLSGVLVAWEGHIYWTNFFANLEKYTLPEISYTNFSGASSGSTTLKAEAKNLEDVSRQIKALQEASFVESVDVSSVAQKVNTQNGERKYEFNISLKVNQDAFNK